MGCLRAITRLCTQGRCRCRAAPGPTRALGLLTCLTSGQEGRFPNPNLRIDTNTASGKLVLQGCWAEHSTSTARPPSLSLNWGAGHRAEGAEHAAIARLRPQHGTAAGARIKELACVGRHGFCFGSSAVRTCDNRFKVHVDLLEHVIDVRSACGICKHGRFKIVDSEVMADGNGK